MACREAGGIVAIVRANAVASEFTKVTNGAVTKQQLQQQQTITSTSNGRHLNINNHLMTSTHNIQQQQSELVEKNRKLYEAVKLSGWIGAVASAVLAIEKQRRSTAVVTEDPSPSAATLRRGKLVENDLVYRQTFVIRSYEAGFDKIASIETIANLFQVPPKFFPFAYPKSAFEAECFISYSQFQFPVNMFLQQNSLPRYLSIAHFLLKRIPLLKCEARSPDLVLV